MRQTGFADLDRRDGVRPGGMPRVVARVIAMAMCLGATIVRAQPLPPDRPPDLATERAAPAPVEPPAVPTPAPATPPALPVDPGPACLAGLASAGIVVEPAPQPIPGNQACQVEVPVKLVSVRDPGGLVAGFPDGPVVACRYARPLGEWLAGIVLPVLRAAHGAPVRAVRTGPGAQCRSRDHLPGEKLSAHATGLALDISGFAFADGKTLLVKPGTGSEADTNALLAVRRAACGWFTTILGPGSDPYHAEHLHLDIQQHGSSDRYRICQ